MESIFGSLIQKVMRKKPKAPDPDLGGGGGGDDDDDDDKPAPPPPPSDSEVDKTNERWRQQKKGLDADNQRGLRPRPTIPPPVPDTQNTRTETQ